MATDRLDLLERAGPVAPPAPSAGEHLVYAIGDIHGRYDLLKDLLKQIQDDVSVFPEEVSRLLLFSGDYIDRGPSSAEVLETLVWLKRASDMPVCFLKGNHEAVLLNCIKQEQVMASWLEFGGKATLASYGVFVPEDPEDVISLKLAMAHLLDKMPASHMAMLGQLEISRIVGDYIFVHAGLRPHVPLHQQSEDDMLWIRDEFVEEQGPFEKLVVHGHTWRDSRPDVRHNRIGIDTGAYSTGVLTAVRLYQTDVKFLHAID